MRQPPHPQSLVLEQEAHHSRSCCPLPCASLGERERCNYALLERACGGVLYTLMPAHIALGYWYCYKPTPTAACLPAPLRTPLQALAVGGAGQG